VLAQLVAFLGVSVVVICVPGPDTALTVRNALAGGRRCGVATAAGVAIGQAVWTLATGVGIAELIQASEPAFLAIKAAGAAYLVALGLQSLWTAAGPRLPARLWTAGSSGPGDGLRSPTGGPGTGGSGCRTPRGGAGAGLGGAGAEPGGAGAEPGGAGAGPGGAGAGPGGAGGAGAGGGARLGLSPGRGLRQGVVSNLANPKMAAFFLSLLPQFVSPGGGATGVLVLGLVFCLMTFAWLALSSAAVDRARVVLGRPRVRRVLDGVSGLLLVGFGARLALQQR
jgi:threonine/homoserine/homoserine lactone efflux protein